MIGRLRGKIELLNGATATVDVGGVGYEVYCSRQLVERLAGIEPTVEQVILIYTAVREDAIQLYGFLDQLEREVFYLLLKVSGIGAKSAIDILSGLDPRDLLRTIAQGDTTRLCSIKGVGKKTAERIVVELRDRVSEMAEDTGSSPVISRGGASALSDAVEALIALGFAKGEAESAVQRAFSDSKIEPGTLHSGEIVREALRFV